MTVSDGNGGSAIDTFVLTVTDPMILVYDTEAEGASGLDITIPLYETVDVTVDWGDGNSDSYTTAGDKTHNYSSHGEYTVKISGSLTWFGQITSVYSNANKLVKVSSFGELNLTSLRGAFYHAVNLIEVPTILPSTVTNTSFIFAYASTFNHNISSWNTTAVTDMSYMFYNATEFNQDIGEWTVSAVTDMRAMFDHASAFNQDIGNWNVSSVSNMEMMFDGCTIFYQNIGNWDVSSVTNMRYMFRDAKSFDQNIGSRDVSSVTNMTSMFQDITLSPANYDALLIGWDTRELQDNVVFHGGDSKYSVGAAATARASIISTDSWTITDGGQANTTPTISDVTDKSTNEDTATSAIVVTIHDDDGDAMTLAGTSSDQTLVPNGNIVFGGTGDNRTVIITPALNQFGTTIITLTVDDSNDGTAEDTFVLTVNSVNDAPIFTSTEVTESTEDVVYIYNIVAEDDDAGATLVITASTLPTWLTLTDAGDGTATLTGTP